MKKMAMVMMMVVAMMMAMATAETAFVETYDMETQHYLVCGIDGEECVTMVVDIFTLADLAEQNAVCSAYAIDCDGVYEIDWDFAGDRFATYGGQWVNGQFERTFELEYVD